MGNTLSDCFGRKNRRNTDNTATIHDNRYIPNGDNGRDTTCSNSSTSNGTDIVKRMTKDKKKEAQRLDNNQNLVHSKSSSEVASSSNPQILNDTPSALPITDSLEKGMAAFFFKQEQNGKLQLEKGTQEVLSDIISGKKGLQKKVQQIEELKKTHEEQLTIYRNEVPQLEHTYTFKRFHDWWSQSFLPSLQDAHKGLEAKDVLEKDLIERIEALKVWDKSLTEQFNKVHILQELMKRSSKDYVEHQNTLEIIPKIKDLRNEVINFIELNDESAIERVVDKELVPPLPHNESLPKKLPEEDQEILAVAKGMRKLYQSKVEQSKDIPKEIFDAYADNTTIKYFNGNFRIITRIEDYCHFNMLIDMKEEEVQIWKTDRKQGLYSSDIWWECTELLSLITKDDSKWKKCIKDEYLKDIKEDNMESKMNSYGIGRVIHKGVNNKETDTTMDLLSKRLNTRHFINKKDDETYKGYISMLGTPNCYGTLFFLEQHKRYCHLEITDIKLNEPSSLDITMVTNKKQENTKDQSMNDSPNSTE